MSDDGAPPFLVLTAICDASARPAAITRSHGDALGRAVRAIGSRPTQGVDIVELPLAPQAFAALRKHLNVPDDTVTVYDLFPVSSRLDTPVRKVAGQFLAAEVLWTLAEQGLLQGVPFSLKLDLPQGWDRDPKRVRSRLVEAGALDLSNQAIETFKAVKSEWERLGASQGQQQGGAQGQQGGAQGQPF